MKSLSFFCILTFLFVGCSDPVSGQGVRDDGPFQAYERQVVFSLSDCEVSWEKRLPNVASCHVNVDKHPESLVWHAGRIIDHWEYSDQDWLVDISFYHTDKGYRIDMYGSRADEDDYFQFDIAKKYIASALYETGRESVRQIVIRPKSVGSLPGELSLGSVEIVNRNLNIHRSSFLSMCSRTWRNGACFVDIVNGTNRESLLDGKLIDLEWGDLFLKTTGFKAWTAGSGLSDYKVYIGTKNTKITFSEFKRQWLRQVPKLNISLKLQKFSKAKASSLYRDKFIQFVTFESYTLKPQIEKCLESYKVISVFQAECRMELPNGTMALADREMINAVVMKNSLSTTVWARVEKGEIVVDIFGGRNLATDFPRFWEIIQDSISQNHSKPILLMRVDHQ